jgi:hypothetical protein
VSLHYFHTEYGRRRDILESKAEGYYVAVKEMADARVTRTLFKAS